ncbi:fatty acid desaturase family protein [Micromonospora sp. CPCC 206061]|uniref:fatty acid desaturase family protein n=1 Tax=Micromonospora sp. CPCC 206061 TaxID=3122410 RepID=UPI003FA52DF8
MDTAVTRVRPRSDYAALLAEIRRAGLLDRRPVYYTAKTVASAVLLVGAWTFFVLLGDSWWQLATAACLAVAFAQFGFLTHDAGHRQIFRSRRANHLIGIITGNLTIGLAFGWWVDKHHRHHAHPNQEGLDPDIGGNNLAYTSSQVRGRRGLGRFLARHQGALFFPMLMLLAVDLRVSSGKALARPDYRRRVPETLLFGLHIAAYLTVVLLVLSPLQALAFVAVHQGLLGLYLGSVFAPNHKGMPILSRADDSDFLRRQVLTSRNVHGGRFTDLLLGGLNYQIEHHLFPSMPRPSLRRAQPIVRAFCDSHNLPYAQTSLLDSYRQALRHLKVVGRGGDPVTETPS